MSGVSLSVLAGLAGIGLGCLVGLQIGSEPAAGPGSGDAVAPEAGRATAPGGSTVGARSVSRFDAGRFEARLDQLAAGQERLLQLIESRFERRAATLPPFPGAAERSAFSAGLESADLDTVAAALQLAEERRQQQSFASQTPRQLASQWERLMERGEFQSAQRAFDELMTRELEPEQRVDYLCEFGEALRDHEAVDQSAQLLQRAMDLSVPGSEQHASASLELAWTRLEQEDAAAALVLADQAVASQELGPRHHGWARFAAAVAAHESGDDVRARRDFESLLAEFSEDREMRWLVRESQERLEELR